MTTTLTENPGNTNPTNAPNNTPTYTTGQFCHTELLTNDVAATTNFMTKVFGWNTTTVPMPGGDGDYTMYSAGGVDLGGITTPPEGMPTGTLSFITVEDVNAYAETITNEGGTILSPPSEVGDHGWMAVFQAPGGPVLAIWQGKN